MKPYKKILSNLFVMIILPILFLSGCIEFQDNESSFEVHEWGVFLHNYDSNIASFVTNPPPIPICFDKPVIYFHCDESLTNVSVEVDINGDILVTIPDANITENGIGWVVDIVNNSVIAPDGASYDYLFYEGQMNISQGIVAYVDDGENITFYVKNICNYPIYDVFFIYGYTHFFPSQKSYDENGEYYVKTLEYVGTVKHLIKIDKLDSGEAKKTVMSKCNNCTIYTKEVLNCLIDQGLTEEEAQEMFDYWEFEWFNTNDFFGDFSKIIYTIPQKIYDELLPINITPKPEKIKRVGLFYVKDIPIINDLSDIKNELINVKTDKNLYHQSEDINVSFNIFSESLGYLVYVGSDCGSTWDRIGLESFNGETWTNVSFIKRSNETINCPMWMPLGPMYMISSESFSYLWDQKTSDLEQIPTGQYRFWLRSAFYPGKNGDTIYNLDFLNMEYYYSNEFAIV